jgi:hypothetical protein
MIDDRTAIPMGMQQLAGGKAIKKVHNPCPKCGSELEMGYGLAGGGIGPYEYCSNEKCNHLVKYQDPEMENRDAD